MSAMSASILAQMATTGAFWLAAYSVRRSSSGLFSNPSSDTLPTNIAGLAVIRHRDLSSACSSFDSARVRAGRPSFSAACTGVSSLHQLGGFLVVAALGGLGVALQALSTVPRSARHSSVWMTSMSEIGSTLPATWITLSSSKQRTTLTMASVSRMWARNWLPRPSPWLAPATRPAMSTNSTMAGTMRSGWMMSASCAGAGRAPRPRRCWARWCRRGSSRRRCRPWSGR
jgi:hypothetical protein